MTPAEKRRQELGLSYKAIEKRLWTLLGPGYTPSDETIRKLFRGERAPSDIVVLDTIAEVLDSTVSTLFPEFAELAGVAAVRVGVQNWKVIARSEKAAA